jgi:hypothetical protein
MDNYVLEDWLNEASSDVASGQSPMQTPEMPDQLGQVPPQGGPNLDPSGGLPSGDPNAMMMQKTDPNMENPNASADPNVASQNIQDISDDPQSPDMPEEKEDKNFEDWKLDYFRESVKGDVSKLMDMIHQVRDLELDSYPRKFVEDNLQILFLRQYSNVDKASKEIRKLIKDNLDQNNPSVSVANHIDNTIQTMPELNNMFIKLKGLLGMKGDLHRKYLAALLGGVQVGSGGNNEDVIYNEREYSIRISTRYNDKWGKVDLGKWSLKEDDPSRYLTEPEQRRMKDGSPEEKDVLRRRVVMESIAEAFNKRSFLVHVVDENGTVNMLGWDISGSIRSAYQKGKLVVKTILSDANEAMIDDNGKITPYVDIKIKYVKETGDVDGEGKPIKEEYDFMERIDGILFLTAQFKILKEASHSFTGIVIKESAYNGNPSDLKVLQRCVPSAAEILMRNC